MKIKKLICILLIMALICAAAACGPRDNNAGGSNASGTASPDIGNNSGAGNASPSANPSQTPSESPSANPSQTPSESPSANPSQTPPESPAAGNGGGTGSEAAGLTGSAQEVLTGLLEALQAAEVWMPMSMPPAAAPEQERKNAIGLSDADYEKYVTDNAQSMAGITTQAHQIVVFRCQDANAAAQVKKLISGDGGYDPQKWICVFPETAIAFDAGAYVLLVASYREVADATVEIMTEAAGSIGEVITFYGS